MPDVVPDSEQNERLPKLRLYSTPESVERGAPTVMAIVETLIAISLSVFIAVHFDTYKWIAVSACIAPFLLLRTEESTERGIAALSVVEDWIRKLGGLWRGEAKWLAWVFVSLLIVPVSLTAVVIRIAVTVQTAGLHPIQTFRAIPANWSRTTLCVDLAHAPEFVPGFNSTNDSSSVFNTAQVLEDVASDWRGAWDDHPLLPILFIPAYLLALIPSLTYRWSLKATSIIYLPLLWLVVTTLKQIREVKTALKRVRHSDISRITIFCSIVVALLFLVKIALMVWWAEFADWIDSTPVGQFASIYVVPAEIPIWQLAAFANAVLAIGVFMFAGEALFRIGNDEAWPTSRVETVLRSMTFTRTVLTMYTVACTLYLTVQAASDWSLPHLGTRLFPWL